MTRFNDSSSIRRKYERIALELSGLAICDTGLRIPCKSLDLSPAGARLRLAQPIRDFPGHTIEQVDLTAIGRLFVSVRWIRDREIGVRFDQGNNVRDQISALLDHLPQSGQRQTNRRVG